MRISVLVRVLLIVAVLALCSAAARTVVPSTLLFHSAERYREEKEYSLAIEEYARLAALRPQSSVPHVRLGEIYAAQGRWQEAEQKFSLARELDPGDAWALAGLARVAAQGGDKRSAVELWRAALALSPRDVEIKYGLAWAYVAVAEFAAAEDELLRVVSWEGDHQRARYLLGLLCAADDRTLADEHLAVAASGTDPVLAAKAQEMLDVVRAIDSGQDEAQRAALLAHAYLRLEEPTLALWQLEQVMALQPENYTARAYAGYALFSLGDTDSARRMLREATRQDPKNPLGYYFLGLLHRSEGYLPTALWEFRRALHLDPSNAAVYSEIANTYVGMGRVAEADEWFRAAVSVAPDEPGFRLLLAEFYADVVQKPERALAAAREAVILAPADPVAQELLGWAHYLMGNLPEARVSLEHALDLDPDSARAYYHLGTVYEEMGDGELARWAFQRAVDLDEDGTYRADAIQRLLTSS